MGRKILSYNKRQEKLNLSFSPFSNEDESCKLSITSDQYEANKMQRIRMMAEQRAISTSVVCIIE